MSAITEINKKTADFIARPQEGAFSRIGHHEKCRSLLRKYMKALEISERAMKSIVEEKNAKSREAKLQLGIRQIELIFLEPKARFDVDDEGISE